MANSLAQMANNPNFIQGLALMRGNDPQKAMLMHSQTQAQNAQREGMQREAEVQAALPQAMQRIKNMPPEEAFDFLLQVGVPAPAAIKLVKDVQTMAGKNISPTSNMQDWDMYSGLSKEDQAGYRGMRRGVSPTDLGGSMVQISPTGEVISSHAKTLAPGQLAQTKQDQAEATKLGNVLGEKKSLLRSIESKMPQMQALSEKLSALGQAGTYTTAGQWTDSLMRQAGLDVPDSAIARTQYMSTVDNEILPLLRDTFGAAFTENEGNSLRATLGDPDKSPPEKDAALAAFVESKHNQLTSLKAEVGSYETGDEKPKSNQSKKIGGVSYIQKNGKWYQE